MKASPGTPSLIAALLLIAIWADFASASTSVLVRIENISDQSRLPVAISQGVWLLHQQSAPLFDPGNPDFGQGLQALAEDGLLDPLRTNLASNPLVSQSDAYMTRTTGGSVPFILPGEIYEFIIFPDSTDTKLTFASAVGDYNDVFIAPGPQGLSLFDLGGNLIVGDVTDQLSLWETGTEINEAPRSGPNQIFVQSAPESGPRGGTVTQFTASTNAMPLADQIAAFSVSESSGVFTITVENISEDSDAISLLISPGVLFLQNSAFSLFQLNTPSDSLGLEALAEDGDASALELQLTTDLDVGDVAMTTALNLGESFSVSLTPSVGFPNLNFAASATASNDAFLALGETGVPLVNASGVPRTVAEIESDLETALKLLDGGFEANEVPGVGPNQPSRQSSPDTGPADPDNRVRLYSDRTNFFSERVQTNFAKLSITNSGGLEFAGQLINISSGSGFPGLLASPIWVIHDGTFELFETNEASSQALARAATDGDIGDLLEQLALEPSVSGFGVVLSDTTSAPVIPPGDQSQVFNVTASQDAGFLNIFAFVAPSNDTFLALGEIGIPLLNGSGTVRSDKDIAQDIELAFSAWDAGAERNQAGGAGPDQAPQQPGAGSGLPENEGLVKLLDDPIWGSHRIGNLVRVTISEWDVIFNDAFEDK